MGLVKNPHARLKTIEGPWQCPEKRVNCPGNSSGPLVVLQPIKERGMRSATQTAFYLQKVNVFQNIEPIIHIIADTKF